MKKDKMYDFGRLGKWSKQTLKETIRVSKDHLHRSAYIIECLPLEDAYKRALDSIEPVDSEFTFRGDVVLDGRLSKRGEGIYRVNLKDIYMKLVPFFDYYLQRKELISDRQKAVDVLVELSGLGDGVVFVLNKLEYLSNYE